MKNSPRLTVAVLTSWYPTPQAPLNGVFIFEQAKVLAAYHEIGVLLPRAVPWRQVLAGRVGPKHVFERIDGASFARERFVALFPRCPARWMHGRMYRTYRRAFEAFVGRVGVPDIIHAHVVLPAGYAAARIGAEYRIPVVLTEHWGDPAANIGTWWEVRLARWAYKHCAGVIAVSPAQECDIKSVEPSSRTSVVGNLVRTDFFTPAPKTRTPSERFRFLSVGIMCQEKGLPYLIEAGARILSRGRTDFEIRVGGDGPLRNELEKLAERRGLAGNCKFLGALSREQVRDEMRTSDVFVLPSLRESFGIVVGEAMACGVPVIATRCGGPEFTVDDDAGVLVPPGDSRCLADEMHSFLNGKYHFDPSRVRASVVRRFGVEAFLRNITGVYEDVLRTHAV
jgi:glycosyltransferase involved in cell wall biosynthesis